MFLLFLLYHITLISLFTPHWQGKALVFLTYRIGRIRRSGWQQWRLDDDDDGMELGNWAFGRERENAAFILREVDGGEVKNGDSQWEMMILPILYIRLQSVR